MGEQPRWVRRRRRGETAADPARTSRDPSGMPGAPSDIGAFAAATAPARFRPPARLRAPPARRRRHGPCAHADPGNLPRPPPCAACGAPPRSAPAHRRRHVAAGACAPRHARACRACATPRALPGARSCECAHQRAQARASAPALPARAVDTRPTVRRSWRAARRPHPPRAARRAASAPPSCRARARPAATRRGDGHTETLSGTGAVSGLCTRTKPVQERCSSLT